MKQRVKRFYYQMKCWWMFKHHMESIGRSADKQIYQCSFCFKRIAVFPFGPDKGIVLSKAGAEAINKLNPIGSKHR